MIFRNWISTVFLNLFFLLFAVKLARTQTPSSVVEQPTIQIKQINLEGNTIFDSELEEITNSFEDRIISPEELFKLRNQLTAFYTSRGYVNSGAFIPPQKFKSGNIKIVIVEGTLAAIEIRGLKNLNKNYLKARLPEENKPLNINQINKSLILLKKDILVANLSAEIISQQIGTNVLLLEIEEESPFEATLRLNNAYSPSIGSFGGNVSVTHNNLLGWGDRLNINRSQTEGLRRTGGFYSFPFNSLDGRITLGYNGAHSEVITEEIKELGIEADYEAFFLKVNQPIIREIDETLNLGIVIEHIDTESFVLGDLSFPFTEGLPDGESKINALRLSQEYSKNWNDALLLINSQFNVGLDIFDATRTERGIDGIFASWQGDLQYLVALDDTNDVVLAARLATQLTTDRLPPTEQFTLGGQGSVIGYRRNIGNADNGILGILELQIALAEGKWGNLSIVPFTNVGNIWNNERETSGANFLASVGLGIRYQLASAVEIRLDYGIPLVEPDGFENSESTDNFTFSVRVVPFKF